LEDSSWLDVFDESKGTETVSGTEIGDAICRLCAMTVTDMDASKVFYLYCLSVRRGGVQRESSTQVRHLHHREHRQYAGALGNGGYVKGVYETVALV
jgi:hypothetical protein